jgi:hypothetical protein
MVFLRLHEEQLFTLLVFQADLVEIVGRTLPGASRRDAALARVER